MTHLQQILMHH